MLRVALYVFAAFVLAMYALMASLPALAGVAAVVDGPQGSLLIHDTTGPCMGSARFAEFVSNDGKLRIGGCWVSNGELMQIAFLDGDMARVPIAALRKPKEV
jgi:hypothetical protein